MPAYYVSLVFSVFLNQRLISAPGLRNLARHVIFLHTFSKDTVNSIDGAYWSLGPEIQFYLVLPLITVALFKIKRKSAATGMAFLGISLLAELLYRLSMLNNLVPDLGPNLPLVANCFLIGMIASEFSAQLARTVIPPIIAWLLEFFILVAFACLAYWVFRVEIGHQDQQIGYLIDNTLEALVYAGFIIVVLHTPGILNWVASLRPLRALGLISYAVYLFHLQILQKPAFTRIVALLFQHPSWLDVFLLITPIAVAIATISYFTIERPFIAFANR